MLFILIRKYVNDISGKYKRLTEATNEIAEGNLDVKIEEDLGIFNPFKDNLEKIQCGFKKAVQEEVKSQRMKTDLISNVSHDLKTPLTAIITYIDLLKDKGRLVVVTFHSLEDRITKQTFKKYSEVDDMVKGLPNIPKEYLPKIKVITKKPILPSQKELEENTRSKSAKLRVAERINYE